MPAEREQQSTGHELVRRLDSASSGDGMEPSRHHAPGVRPAERRVRAGPPELEKEVRREGVAAGAAADALLAKLAALDQAVDAARAALSAVRAALDEGSAGAGVTEEVVSAERRERQPSPPAEAASVTTREPPAAVEVPTEPVPKPLPMRRSYFLDFQ